MTTTLGLRKAIAETDVRLEPLRDEPALHREEIADLMERRAKAMLELATKPWAADTHELVATAGFFREVEGLNLWQKSKVLRALRRLQEHGRERAMRRSTPDEFLEGLHWFPASRVYSVVFSWPPEGCPEAHSIVQINASIFGV
jgi:hypothetical protein